MTVARLMLAILALFAGVDALSAVQEQHVLATLDQLTSDVEALRRGLHEAEVEVKTLDYHNSRLVARVSSLEEELARSNKQTKAHLHEQSKVMHTLARSSPMESSEQSVVMNDRHSAKTTADYYGVGPKGERGERGFKGDRGDRGYCVFVNQTSNAEVELECPDAADSDIVQLNFNTIAQLARVLIMLQSQTEQAVRNAGGSGLVRSRAYNTGSNSYNAGGYANFGVANVHNHADNKYTVGMGEIVASLNGVMFQTRHNDYALVKPSTTDSSYHATEYITLPAVPTQVSSLGTVAEQVDEMREWFRAFKEQDEGIRPYKAYFKPILCYLEGAWITDTAALDEPFDSDRHLIEAKTWSELHDRSRFLLNSGRKNNNENIPFLPTSIRSMTGPNNTIPVLANFEARILCQPLASDVPLNRFKLVDEYAPRMYSRPDTRQKQLESRRARFQLNGYDQDQWHEGPIYQNGYLDDLMEQIPGKDNAAADLTDQSFGYLAKHRMRDEVLNTGFYSRYYSIDEADAMGRAVRKRSFNDPNLFAAMTTHEKVSALSAEDGFGEFVDPMCTDEYVCERVPNVVTQRWTWAIPLEIIYLTPLTEWNPYGIQYYEYEDAGYNQVMANGRNGLSAGTAFQGTRRDTFYRTPPEFFSGSDAGDAADTNQASVYVLDSTGTARQVAASGHWILFPDIQGLGKIRQRYPIMPVHEEDSTAWKELEAFKDVLALDGLTGDGVSDNVFGVDFLLTMINGHTHEVSISGAQVDRIVNQQQSVVATSSLANGHTHQVTITYDGTGELYVGELPANDEAHGFIRV